MVKKQYIWWMTKDELVQNFRTGLINGLIPAFQKLPNYVKNLLCWINEAGYRDHAVAFLFNKQHKDVEQAQLGTIDQMEFQAKVGLIFDENDLDVVKTAIRRATWDGGKLTDFQLRPISVTAST